MSSQSHGATQQSVESSSLIESSQKEFQKEFQPVVELLELNQFKPEQLLEEDPKMKQFKVLLQRTIQAVLGPRSISDAERLIVGECLNIWISMISHSSERLLDLYQDSSYLNLLIDQGLVSDNLLLRNQFKEAISFVCYRIKQNNLPEAPSIFFLRVLLCKLEMICAQKNSKTQQYFGLLSELIGNYYKLKKSSPLIFQQIFDPVQLTTQALEQLNIYQSSESRNNPQVDQTLVGLLVLVRDLLTHEPNQILNKQQKSIVLQMLVEKCLFNQQTAEFQGHITSKLDFQRMSETTLNKCHSDESRDATYSLFQVLIGQNPDIYISKELLGKYWVPSIFQLSASKSHQFASKDRDNRSELGYAGLKNLGCICYMNACIQQLFNVPAFRYCLLAANDGKDKNLVDVNGREVDDNQLHQWQRMFGALELTERESYNPEDFCYSFKRGGQPVNVREQQDAQEFVGYAFDKIEESLKHTPFRHLMDQFQGLNTNITICKNCFNIVQTDQAFATLQLTVKNQKSIYDSLRLMIAGELIQDYNCRNCERKVEIKRCSTIKRLPNTLIVHLQRLVFDFDTMAQKKLNDRVEFPNVLNVQEFMLDEVIQSIKRDKRQLDDQDGDEIMEEKADPTCFEYKLVGVVIHMGTADAGHYISYVNIERNSDSSVNTEQWLQTEKQQWLEFNDNQVKPFDFSQLAFKAFGEQQQSKGISQIQTSNTDFQEEATQAAQASHNAYMLVYEKRVKEPLKLVLEEQTISKIMSLVCDGTTIPRELQEQLPFEFVAIPSLLNKVLTNQFAENTVDIPVSEVQKFVPNSIYSQINRDNQLHITESQVCCNPFFKTTAMLLNNLVKHCDAPDVLGDIYAIVDRLIFDLLIRTTQNAELDNITAILLELIQNSPDLLLRLVNERILFTQQVSDNVCDQPFFEMLIFHKEQNTREMCERILTKVTNNLFEMLEYPALRALTEDQLTQYSEILEKIIEVAVSVIPGKITNAWHKLGPFFNFLYNVIKDKKMNRLVMFRKNRLVSRLVELICKIKDHFQNGYNYGAPPVEFAIRTLALIVRSQPLLIWLYKIPLNKQVSIEEYEQVIAEGGKSPHHLGQHNFYLDSEDVRNIFMTEKRVKNLWDLCLQYAGSVEAIRQVSITIAHLMYRNYDFSRKFAKLLLTGLNKTQAEEIKPYAMCMQEFFLIKDEFQMHRLEWIFGLPSITMQRTGNNYYNQDASYQQLKIGCNKIQSVDDVLYDYQTPLLKDQSKMSEVVLEILFKYKKSGFAEVVLVLLDHLLEAALLDQSQQILVYLLKNQGPSYTCRRYWDWIEPFILHNIQESFNNASSANKEQTAEVNLRILDHIQKLKEKFADTIEAIKGPEPYLLWDVIGTKDINTEIYQSKSFHVVLQEITTTISKSTPNPAEGINENIQKVNKSGWQQSSFKAVKSKRKRVAKKSRQQLTQATKYGRGSRAENDQSVYKKRETDAEPERTVWETNFVEGDMDCNKFPQDDDNFHDYDDNMPKIQMRDSGQEAPIIQGLNQDVLMEDIGQNPDDEHWSDKLNQSSDQEFDQNYPKIDSTANNYTMAADQMGVFGDVIEQVQDNQNTQEPAYQKQGEVNQDSTDKSDEDDEEETAKYQVETILQLLLRNFHRTRQQTCRFQFDPDNADDCNYLVPTAELYQNVNTQTDHTFVRFTKLRPYEGWGSLKFKFFVDDEDMDGRNTKYDRNWLALRNMRTQVDDQQFEEVPLVEPEQEKNYDDGGSVPYTGFGELESGVITCQVCTFDNQPSLSKCEMCDSPLT